MSCGLTCFKSRDNGNGTVTSCGTSEAKLVVDLSLQTKCFFLFWKRMYLLKIRKDRYLSYEHFYHHSNFIVCGMKPKYMRGFLIFFFKRCALPWLLSKRIVSEKLLSLLDENFFACL